MSESFVHRGVKIERHGLRWRWRLRERGPQVWRSFETLGDAKEQLERVLDRRERDHRRVIEGDQQPITVSALCDAWFIDKKPRIAPATAKQYGIHIRVHIRPSIGDKDAGRIRPRELEAFYASLRWKPAKESHNILRQAFEWGLRNDVLTRPSNPCLVVRPSRRACTDHDGFYDTNDRIAPIDEKLIPRRVDIEKLLVDADTRGDRTWWLYLKLATATGARPGEVCALRRMDLDVSRHTIRIEWSADRISGRLKRPKTRWSVRTLPLGPELFSAIQSALPEDPTAFLFPANTYMDLRSPLPCWNSRTVNRRLDEALGRTGVRHFTPHALRHYAATHLLDQGYPPLQVARFLGHANDNLVRTLYANHIVDEEQRRIGAAASRLV